MALEPISPIYRIWKAAIIQNLMSFRLSLLESPNSSCSVRTPRSTGRGRLRSEIQAAFHISRGMHEVGSIPLMGFLLDSDFRIKKITFNGNFSQANSMRLTTQMGWGTCQHLSFEESRPNICQLQHIPFKYLVQIFDFYIVPTKSHSYKDYVLYQYFIISLHKINVVRILFQRYCL